MFGTRRSRNYNSRVAREEPYGVSGTTEPVGTRRRGLFGNRSTRTGGTRRGWFSRKVNPDRRAAGLKGALANPNTTHTGRQEAKAELHAMGRSAHVPLSVKIKRTLGIRSTPRRQRTARRHVL